MFFCSSYVTAGVYLLQMRGLLMNIDAIQIRAKDFAWWYQLDFESAELCKVEKHFIVKIINLDSTRLGDALTQELLFGAEDNTHHFDLKVVRNKKEFLVGVCFMYDWLENEECLGYSKLTAIASKVIDADTKKQIDCLLEVQ